MNVFDYSLTDAVERGARLLDAHRPGWWRKIDLNALQMENPCLCVLGQVLGNFHHYRDIGVAPTGHDHEDNVDNCGFDFSSQCSFHALQDAWTALIRERQKIMLLEIAIANAHRAERNVVAGFLATHLPTLYPWVEPHQFLDNCGVPQHEEEQ